MNLNIPPIAVDGDTLQHVFGGIIIGVAIFLYVHARNASKNKESKFSFEDLFMDISGKTSIDKVGQFIALIVSTWAFVYYTLAYKLSDWFFWGYMGIWAAAKAGNKWLDIKREMTPSTSSTKDKDLP